MHAFQTWLLHTYMYLHEYIWVSFIWQSLKAYHLTGLLSSSSSYKLKYIIESWQKTRDLCARLRCEFNHSLRLFLKSVLTTESACIACRLFLWLLIVRRFHILFTQKRIFTSRKSLEFSRFWGQPAKPVVQHYSNAQVWFA